MKPASLSLINLLVSGVFSQADLYTFTYVGGGVLRITTADVDILSGGFTWSSKGPFVDTKKNPTAYHAKAGLDVDTWVVEITPRPVDPITGATFPDKIGSQPWLAAVRAGALDGAELQVDRAYWPQWPTPWSSPITPTEILSSMFAGRVSQIDITRTSAVITVNSHLELLTTLMPRNLFQSGCAHTLFDAGCTLSAAAFAKSGVVTAVPAVGAAQNLFTASIAAPAGSASYRLGRVVMTSGANAGFSRMVRDWNSGTGVFTLMGPLPFTLAIGDGFTAYPGCDKTAATCALFANSVNFGGTPFIPAPEAAF